MTVYDPKTGLNISEARRVKRMSSCRWRLNNLYWILNEQGEPIKFKMNPAQWRLYRLTWWLNVIPKSRQHGITTFIALFILDACLFNSNTKAGIIAHRLDDAKRILREKIHFAYDRLPPDVKASRPLLKDDSLEMIIGFMDSSGHLSYDKSSIWVSTSMRSGTLNILHISEYGKLCARMPVKAKEVKTGAMPTVHKGGFIFVESTSEGPFGDFYDMCLEAMANEGRENAAWRRLDWKLHFFGWMDKESNVVDGAVDIPPEVNEYLDKIEKVYDRILTINQRAWYALTKKRFKHDMFKEHPSTLEECFLASVEGAFYAMEISRLREDKRITSVPHFSRDLVHTACDLGVGSHMPWIFFQICGKEVHIINEFNLKKEDAQGGAVFYREMLDEYRRRYHYQYGKHFSPHDVSKGEIGSGQTIFQSFADGGIHFTKLSKEKSVLEGIERTRQLFDSLWISAECKETIKGLSSYHREWVEGLNMYQEKPKADDAAHWADVVRYLSMIVDKKLVGARAGVLTAAKVRQWARKYRRVG